MDDTPGPSLADRLSITALVISLVALFIGVGSLLQAILGTAEGYRRCAYSVIGPWSALRRRIFKTAEFRLETKFVTPLIVLVSPYDLQQASDTPGADALYLLNPNPEDTADESSWTRSGFWWQRYNPAQVLDSSLHLPDFTAEPGFRGAHNGETTFRHVRSPQHAMDVDEKLEPSASELKPGRGRSAAIGSKTWGKSRKKGPRNGLPVTWIRLLRDLHLLYLNYWPDEPSSCGNVCIVEDNTKPIFSEAAKNRAVVNETAQRHQSQWQNTARTRVAIIPVEETWDFLPPDVSRPLASSTIGFVLVLVLRLGMQWRSLDRTRSQMSADGNGFNITSTDVKGMGIVLRFNTFNQHEHVELLIPSRAVDKMMCGIVPGDPRLVGQDFHLVDRDRKVRSICDTHGVLERIGLPDQTIDEIREANRWSTQNEVITLLSSFLPLPCCHLTGFYFPAWVNRQYTILHFFESRLALHNFLKNSTLTHTSVTSRILQQLNELVEHFGFDFYNGYYKHVPAERESIQRSVDLTEWCAARFEETTDYFIKHGYQDNNNSTRTWYMQLVAAHARLSSHITRGLSLDRQRPQVEILAEYNEIIEAAEVETEYFSAWLYQIGTMYAEHTNDESVGVVAYLRQRGFRRPTSDIVDAWWMLMFRGLVWDMSCKCLPYPGEPVPSSYYEDETSVWFT